MNGAYTVILQQPAQHTYSESRQGNLTDSVSGVHCTEEDVQHSLYKQNSSTQYSNSLR